MTAITEDLGMPEYDRRLTDKLLAAFDHAYAIGAHEIAARLRSILADVDEAERAAHDRRRDTALVPADLWVAFVEARGAYDRIVVDKSAGERAVESALENMKEAYRRWSDA
jgi:hypothetical protein